MTDTGSESVTCPVCKSESMTSWDGVDSLVCDNCSYVIDSDSEVTKPDNSIEISPAREQNESSEHPDWQTRVSVKDNSEANLVDALSQAETVATDLSLPDDVVVRAGEVVANAWKMNFMHGRTTSKLVGAAVYAVSREQEIAAPPGVVAEKTGVEKSSIKKTYKQLKDELQLELGPPAPAEFVGYICQTLELPDSVQKESTRLLEETANVGGNPIGTAAASVYEVSTEQSEDVTFREIAQATSLTKETVWRHADKLRSENST